MMLTLSPPPLYTDITITFLDGPLFRVERAVSWGGPYPDTIPAGFVSDGGSKPSITWPIIGHPLSRRVLICYLLHDLDLSRNVQWSEATRRLDARLRAVGCPEVRRLAIIAGVTARGWFRS